MKLKAQLALAAIAAFATATPAAADSYRDIRNGAPTSAQSRVQVDNGVIAVADRGDRGDRRGWRQGRHRDSAQRHRNGPRWQDRDRRSRQRADAGRHRQFQFRSGAPHYRYKYRAWPRHRYVTNYRVHDILRQHRYHRVQWVRYYDGYYLARAYNPFGLLVDIFVNSYNGTIFRVLYVG